MGTSRVQRVTFDTGTYLSDPASTWLFGANVLLGRDDLSGSYHTKTASWDLTLLRYPGGGLTEDYFDPTNPDAQILTPVAGHLSLTGFLAYCHANGHRPVIVLPTKRYVPDPVAGEQEIRDFVAAVTRGDYGPVTDPIFEVGNEYYASTTLHGPIATADYAAIASRLAVAVADAAQIPSTVIVQAARYAQDNATIISAFDTTAEKAAVDGVAFHQYPWVADAVAHRFSQVSVHLAQWEDAGIASMSFMSEWNVGSSTDSSTDHLHDYGQAQNAALMEIVWHAVVTGVDFGAIWGIQQNNNTSLTANEGNSAIHSAGEMYAMMAQSIPGMQPIGRTELFGGVGVTYAFEGHDEIAVFVSASEIDLNAGPVQLDIGLHGAAGGFSAVSADSLTTLGDPYSPKPAPHRTQFTPDLIAAEGDLFARIWLTQDYQTVRLTFTKQSAVTVGATKSGSLTSDVLAGGSGGDTLRGHGGTDYIFAHDGNDDARGGRMSDEVHGGAGHDTINGGSADDALHGGGDNDLLQGRAGSDQLYGDAGTDTLLGGPGRDFLYGGAGDDRLEGGAGNDRYWGGTGADVFVFEDGMLLERVYDFEPGVDRVDLSAASGVTGMADLAFSDWQGHLEVTTPQGIIRLRFVTEEQISDADFLF